MQILVTGNAGFIGHHLALRLAQQGHQITGIDSLNDYYDVRLKKARLAQSGITTDEYGKEYVSAGLPYRFRQLDLCDKAGLERLFTDHQFDIVVNLAAQAGVRYSLINPTAYIDSNITGFLNLLEQCRHHQCPRLIYASSSSVYGNTQEVPFREDAPVDHPVSLYAATKKSNELMAYTYAHLYRIQTIGLRFFTVYGPWGRPDMAPLLFANAITNGQPIKVFNNGELSRDFTYIDDIIDGIQQIINHPERAREDNPGTPAVVYNIGHGSPMPLMRFIALLEQNLGRKAIKEYTGMQAGDVYRTWADTSKLLADYGYVPKTTLEEGIKQFTDWFKNYKSILPDKK